MSLLFPCQFMQQSAGTLLTGCFLHKKKPTQVSFYPSGPCGMTCPYKMMLRYAMFKSLLLFLLNLSKTLQILHQPCFCTLSFLNLHRTHLLSMPEEKLSITLIAICPACNQVHNLVIRQWFFPIFITIFHGISL